MKPKLHDWLALNRLPGIGPKTQLELIDHFGSVRNVFSATQADWVAIGLKPDVIAKIKQPDWSAIEKELVWLHDSGDRAILTWDDPQYPDLLRETPGAPTILYIKGRVEFLSIPQVAIVGSRNPTAQGVDLARRFSMELVAAGFGVTSGLALGVDGACHQGAIDANGVTIAVLGSGLQRVYPAKHRNLAQRVSERGALVSEFSPAVGPLPEHFPRRNRIISGLSLGVLVVEAAKRSGSLITARYALEHGREVFAMPGSICNPLSRGGHSLIKDGAKLVETVEDIIDELGAVMPAVSPIVNTQTINEKQEVLATEHQLLLNCMNCGMVSVDNLLSSTGLSPEKLFAMLTELELAGKIEAVPGGYSLPIAKK